MGAGVAARCDKSTSTQTQQVYRRPLRVVVADSTHSPVARTRQNPYNATPDVGTWRSLVARVLWEHDAAGSNPVVPTICGRSSMVEPQPSKLMTRVRFPSPAPENVRARCRCGAGLVSLHVPGIEPGSGYGAEQMREHLPAKYARREAPQRIERAERAAIPVARSR